MRRLILLAVSLAPFSGLGCAAVKNARAPEPKAFGGTAMSCGDFCVSEEHPAGLGTGFMVLLFWPAWLCDKPLSLAGDCVALPYVLWKRAECRSPRIDPDPPGLREALASRPAGTVGPAVVAIPVDLKRLP